MLVLTRRIGETIVIAGDIRVTVVALKGGKVRLCITAPAEIQVDRLEVHEQRLLASPVGPGLSACSAPP